MQNLTRSLEKFSPSSRASIPTPSAAARLNSGAGSPKNCFKLQELNAQLAKRGLALDSFAQDLNNDAEVVSLWDGLLGMMGSLGVINDGFEISS